MTTTAYIDESLRSGHYHLCAVLVPDARLAPLRRELKVIGRRKSLHMRDSDRRLRKLQVRQVAGLGLPAVIASTRGTARTARDATLACLVPEVVRRGARSLVIESCDQDAADRRLLKELLDATPRTTYSFRPKGDPVLGVADLIAWTHPHSSDYRLLFGASVTRLHA